MSLKTDVNGIKDEIMAYYDQEHTHYGNDATFIDWDSKQTFLEDCAKIAHFLANGETQVVPMLNAIEAEIGLRVDSNLGQAISYWERKQARYTSLINAKYEQSVLGQLPYPDAKSQWQKNSNDEWKRTSSPVAKEGLFGGVVPGILKQGLMTGTAFDGDFPVFVSFINTTDFNKNLVSKHHWKDPGVNPSHGEFTHQIQWWAIVMAKDTIGLTGKVSEVFEEIGKVYVKNKDINGRNATAVNQNNGLGLWEIICDIGVDTFPFQVATDFRWPDGLLAYILDHGSQFPLLSAFLGQRQTKRAFELKIASLMVTNMETGLKPIFEHNGVGFNSNNMWSVNYLLRKKFGRRKLPSLLESEQETLFNTIKSGII